MSRQWFSLVPTSDMSFTDISQVDISNIKAIFKLTHPNLAQPGTGIYTAFFDINNESNNWIQIFGDPSTNWNTSLIKNFAYWIYCRPSEESGGSVDFSNVTNNGATILYTCNVNIGSLEIVLNGITLSCLSGVTMVQTVPESSLFYNNNSIIVSQFNTANIPLSNTAASLLDISYIAISNTISFISVKFNDLSGNEIPNIATSISKEIPPPLLLNFSHKSTSIQKSAPTSALASVLAPASASASAPASALAPVLAPASAPVLAPIQEPNIESEFITLDISNITSSSIDLMYKTNFDWRSFEVVFTNIDIESASSAQNINIPIHIKNSKTIVGVAIGQNNTNKILASNNFETLFRLNYKNGPVPYIGIQTATIIDCNLKIKYPYPGLAQINPMLPYIISNPLYPNAKISIGNVSYGQPQTNTVIDIVYNSNQPIGIFEIYFSGVNIIGAYGGTAAANNISILHTSTKVFGYTISENSLIPSNSYPENKMITLVKVIVKTPSEETFLHIINANLGNANLSHITPLIIDQNSVPFLKPSLSILSSEEK